MSSITAKTITLNSKALNLKTINQLIPLDLDSTGFECVGFYNVKNINTYIFSNGKELRKFIDKKWTISKSFKNQLCGPKNLFKSFSNSESRDLYFEKYKNITDKLVETHLFY